MLLACVMKTAASTMITSSRASKPLLWSSCRRRPLSSAQVSTALRPFYFLIHPDLFGKWPQEQAVNEASLKQLKSYLNIMLDEKRRPQPLTVTFYVKPRLSSRKNLRKIQLNLASEAKIRKSIVAILSTVELPTSYVDSIPDVESDLVTAGQLSSHFESTIFGFEDNELDFQSKIELMHPTDTRRGVLFVREF